LRVNVLAPRPAFENGLFCETLRSVLRAASAKRASPDSVVGGDAGAKFRIRPRSEKPGDFPSGDDQGRNLDLRAVRTPPLPVWPNGTSKLLSMRCSPRFVQWPPGRRRAA
jgi:hypothetical protein